MAPRAAFDTEALKVAWWGQKAWLDAGVWVGEEGNPTARCLALSDGS